MKSEKTITEGMLVPCLMAGTTDEWSTAEIIKIRSTSTATPPETAAPDATSAAAGADAADSGKRLFYVHYVDFNKRLDCWVSEDRLDIAKARLKGQEAAVAIKKEESASGSGRCSSPTPSAIKDVSNLAAAATTGKCRQGLCIYYERFSQFGLQSGNRGFSLFLPSQFHFLPSKTMAIQFFHDALV